MTAADIIRAGVAADPMRLPAYGDFVSAMTSEDLHSKADIAQVLAWQAKGNTRLRRVLTHLVQRVMLHSTLEDHESWFAIVDAAEEARKMLESQEPSA